MSISIRGDIGKIEIDVKNKMNHLKNIDKVLDRIASDMKKETQLNFRNSKGPDGTKWKELSPITLGSRKNRSNKPLVDRGTLRRSISTRVEGNQAIIGTNLKYARIHQYGGEIKPRKGSALKVGSRSLRKVIIPARPYIGINERMLYKYRKWLVEG